jgi:hypothetical protein
MDQALAWRSRSARVAARRNHVPERLALTENTERGAASYQERRPNCFCEM